MLVWKKLQADVVLAGHGGLLRSIGRTEHEGRNPSSLCCFFHWITVVCMRYLTRCRCCGQKHSDDKMQNNAKENPGNIVPSTSTTVQGEESECPSYTGAPLVCRKGGRPCSSFPRGRGRCWGCMHEGRQNGHVRDYIHGLTTLYDTVNLL